MRPGDALLNGNKPIPRISSGMAHAGSGKSTRKQVRFALELQSGSGVLFGFSGPRAGAKGVARKKSGRVPNVWDGDRTSTVLIESTTQTLPHMLHRPEKEQVAPMPSSPPLHKRIRDLPSDHRRSSTELEPIRPFPQANDLALIVACRPNCRSEAGDVTNTGTLTATAQCPLRPPLSPVHDPHGEPHADGD